jgi:hypothetical protein
MDYTTKRHVKRNFTNFGGDRRWLYQSPSSWQKINYWLSIYPWSTWHFLWRNYGCCQGYHQKVKIVLKKIIGPNEFVENEQWSVICMKEKFHPRFATILQISYQWKQFSYFSNHIIITKLYNLPNNAQHVN